jgi:hypothetical protein
VIFISLTRLQEEFLRSDCEGLLPCSFIVLVHELRHASPHHQTGSDLLLTDVRHERVHLIALLDEPCEDARSICVDVWRLHPDSTYTVRTETAGVGEEDAAFGHGKNASVGDKDRGENWCLAPRINLVRLIVQNTMQFMKSPKRAEKEGPSYAGAFMIT